jgi:hexokinase
MKELDELRNWLLPQKQEWPRIASAAQLSTKTLSRIANDTSYKVTLQTYLTLEAIRKTEEQAAA